MSDPTSPDSVARSMGLGGDLPPADDRPRGQAAPVVSVAGGTDAMGADFAPGATQLSGGAPAGTAFGAAARLPAGRRGFGRAVLVALMFVAGGYGFAVFASEDDDGLAITLLAGGMTAFAFFLPLGLGWWLLRLLAGRRRPFGRTVFNYPLVAVYSVLFALIGLLGD